MGKGSSAPAEQTITQTSLPDYAEPYFTRLLERTEGQSLAGYTPYEGQRLTQTSPDVTAAYDLTRQVAGQGIAGLPEAAGVLASNVAAGQGIAAGTQPFQYSDPGRYTGATVQEYMSPYMQAVVDEQVRQARQQYGEQAGARQAQAVRAGAFGGSRQAVQEAIGERDLLNRIAGITATGTQQAFEQGAQMFGADRAALMAQEQAQAAADQQAAQQQLQALGFSGQQAQQMVGLGETGRAADVQAAQLLETIGEAQMGREQEALDLAYQDFIRQQAYPEQQLQLYSSILRGVPVEPSVTQTAYVPYNPLQQALGAGLGAIGLYRGMTA